MNKTVRCEHLRSVKITGKHVNLLKLCKAEVKREDGENVEEKKKVTVIIKNRVNIERRSGDSFQFALSSP